MLLSENQPYYTCIHVSQNAVQETLDIGKTNEPPKIIRNSSQAEKSVNRSRDTDIPSVNFGSTSENLTNVLILGSVLKQPLKLLVDKGAAVIVVNEQFYNAYLRQKFPLTQDQRFDSIKTADGNMLPVMGAVTFQLVIGNVQYQCEAAVVPKLSYRVVLGREFLYKTNAVRGVA